MSIFSKPKVVLYPQNKSTNLYIDKKENNVFSFEINLWEEHQEKDLEAFLYFLKQNKIEQVSILVPDDVVLTKSFIYDTKIEQIEKKEVIGLAESFIDFKIAPESIEYILIQEENKTLIRAQIYEPKKINALKTNLSKLGLSVTSLKPVSSALIQTISDVNKEDFFFVYPLGEYDNTLILSKNGLVYLTANLKGKSLDIQKIVNYSKLYFNSITKKIYLPENRQLEVVATTKLEQTLYSESQIAQTHNKPSNIPLPVIAELSVSNQANPVIIDKPTEVITKKPMENKKNILPIIAVFVFTAALASVVIWYVLNKNNTEELENPGTDQTAVEEITPTEAPIETPTPTMAAVKELSKSIKIQVLNGTDINGQAATVKNMLTKLGFTSVAVGNSKETATENQVQLKESLTGGEAYFESKLNSQFPATYTTDLKETGTYDVVFIIGTDLSDTSSSSSATVTPTKKLTPTATKSATPTEAE